MFEAGGVELEFARSQTAGDAGDVFAEKLDVELTWINERVNGKQFGIDLKRRVVDEGAVVWLPPVTPTKSGTTIDGNTTMPRRGRTG